MHLIIKPKRNNQTQFEGGIHKFKTLADVNSLDGEKTVLLLYRLGVNPRVTILIFKF